MLEFFSSIKLTDSGVLNMIIQVLLFEISAFVAVPLTGIIVNSVIVGGIRSVFVKILGGKIEFVISNYVMFVGVMIHELSHALFALITGAEVLEVALFKPDGGSLGHVTFRTRGGAFVQALQNSFSSCAPVVMGLVISYLFITKLFPILGPTWQWVIVLYVFISVVFHMNMSSADLKIYFKGALPLLLVFLPICFVIFLIK